MKKVLYRLEINYLSKDYDDRALNTSSPIYTKKEGWTEYKKALNEKCIDNKEVSARVHFWKYNWNGNDLDPITIAKNY